MSLGLVSAGAFPAGRLDRPAHVIPCPHG